MSDPDYGTDVSTFVGGRLGAIDRSFALVSGRRCVAEKLLRSWTTPRGTLITDENAGVDVLEWLSAKVATGGSAISALVSMLKREALRLDQVSDIDVAIAVSSDGRSMRITGSVYPADASSAPFPFVFVLSADTIAILEPTA